MQRFTLLWLLVILLRHCVCHMDIAVYGLIIWNRAQPLGSRIVCVLLALSLNLFLAVATIVLRVEYGMDLSNDMQFTVLCECDFPITQHFQF